AYAIATEQVVQIEMVEQITPVPNAPAVLDGAVMVRGQVLPAISLRVRFGFERQPYSIRNRLVVVASGGRTVGLIVDSAREFVRIPASTRQPPPETIAGLSGDYIESIAMLGDRMVLILDLAAVLGTAAGGPLPIAPIVLDEV